jgi:hypothetical protein
MIKANFNRWVAAALVVATQAVIPAASAQVRPQGSVAQNFCSRITAFGAQIETRLNDRQTALKIKRDGEKKRLIDHRAAYQEKKKEVRTEAATKRNEALKKLEATVETEEQKNALIAFKAAMETAMTARKASVDAAQKAFQEGLDKVVADRKASSDAIVASFRAAVKAAFAAAKADCAAKTDPETVKENLKAALEAARQKFQTDRNALAKQGDAVKVLVETRQAAFQKAHDDFKAAAEKARDELKTAFGAAGI